MRFGVRGRSPGQLQRPTGVTVDSNGDIIVADYDNRWISIFSSDGKFKVNRGKFREVRSYYFKLNTKNTKFVTLGISEQNWSREADGTQRCGCG